MHITTKGQVTIPQKIRDEFGFLPDSEVQFQVEKGRVYLVKVDAVPSRRGHQLIEKMRGKGDVQLSTEEILALTRNE